MKACGRKFCVLPTSTCSLATSFPAKEQHIQATAGSQLYRNPFRPREPSGSFNSQVTVPDLCSVFNTLPWQQKVKPSNLIPIWVSPHSFSLSWNSIGTCRLTFLVFVPLTVRNNTWECCIWENPAWTDLLSEILAWVDGYWLCINIQALWHHLCRHIRNGIMMPQIKSF